MNKSTNSIIKSTIKSSHLNTDHIATIDIWSCCRREMKEMSRMIDRQEQQISSLKRMSDRFNLEEEVMGIKYELLY